MKMVKMRKTWFVTVFILFLLPVVSAIGYNYVDVFSYGNDNLPGYLRERDRLRVDVTDVTIEDVDPVTSNHVSVKNLGGEFLFSTCSGSPASCTYVTGSELTRNAGTVSGWKVRFYNSSFPDHNANTFAGETFGFGYVVDIVAPVITFDLLEQNNRNVRIFYTVEDDDGSSGTDCAGIKEVEIVGKIKDAAGSGNTIESILYDYDNCALRVDPQGQEFTDLSVIGVSDSNIQDITICIQARDRLGQPDNIQDNRVCKDLLNYDLKNPFIDLNTFVIIDADGNSVETLTLHNGLQLTASVNITEDSSPLTVTGDFSALNEILDEAGTTCTLQNNINTCTWSFSVLNPSFDLNVELNATDKWKNNQLATKNFGTTAIDNDAPVVLWIRSDKIIDGVSYLKLTNNTITVRLHEEGSGFDDENITLKERAGTRLEPVGSGKPNGAFYRNCTAPFTGEEGLTVIDCKWTGVNVSSSVPDRANFVLTVDGEDDVGNNIDDSACSQAIPNECTSSIDKRNPDIREVSIEAEDVEQLSIDDSFTINVKFFEDGSGFDESTYTFASTDGNCNLNKQADSCTPISARYLWSCVWNANINDESCFTNDINITISDKVDNTAESVTKITETTIPEIRFFNTSFDGWIGEKNDIEVTIFEIGSGINSTNVILNEKDGNLLRIDHGRFLYNHEADFCDNDIGTINCFWYNLTCDNCQTDDNVKLEVEVTDNSDQTVTAEADFTVDLTSPELVEDTVVIRDIQSRRTDFVASGNSMDIIANVTELRSGVVTAYLNLTNLSLSDNIPAHQCFNTSDMWECTWNEIELRSDISGLGLDVEFNFLDKALNKLTYIQEIDVLVSGERDETFYDLTKVELWKDSRGETRTVSRRILVNTPDSMFVNLEWKKKDSGAETTIIEKEANCISVLQFVQRDSAYLIFGRFPSSENTIEDTLKMIIGDEEEGALGQTSLENLPNFTVSCEVSLKVRPKRSAEVFTEIHTFDVVIPLKRSPYDDIPGMVLDDINSSRKEWVEATGIIGVLDKFIETAARTCTAFGAFSRGYQVLQYAKPIVFGVSQLLPGAQGLWPAYAKLVGFTKKLKDLVWSPWEIIGKSREAEEAAETVSEATKWWEPYAGGPGKLGFFKRMCAFTTCNQCFDPNFKGLWNDYARSLRNIDPGDYMHKVNEFLSGTYSETFGGVRDEPGTYGLLADPNDPDEPSPFFKSSISPDRSFIAAVSCGCVPAIIKHVQRLRAINCRYIDCKKEAATQIFDTELCEIRKEKETCVFWQGAIWNVLPYVEPLTLIVNLIEGVIKDLPARGLTVLRKYACGAVDAKLEESINTINEGLTEWDTSGINPYQSILCGAADALLLSYDGDDFSINEYAKNTGLPQSFKDIYSITIPFSEASSFWKGYVDECEGIYCDDDDDCNEAKGEKCFDGVCFNLERGIR